MSGHEELAVRVATPDDVPGLHRVRMSVRENVLADPGSISPELTLEMIGGRGRRRAAIRGRRIAARASG